MLQERDVPAALDFDGASMPGPGEARIAVGALSAGAEYPQLNLAVLTEGQLTAAPAGKNIEKLKSVIKYVELHYASPMSIEQMAGLAGFSKSHFMKYFRQTMGVPFTAYLNSYRLTMAARLLLQSDDTVLSIASEVGFDNLSYFNRAFKKQYGMTPSTYRGQV